MSDRLDSKIRELTMRLMQSSPEAPPFPEDTMSHLVPEPPRRRMRPVWVAVAGAVAVLVVVGVPFWLFGGNDQTPSGATTTTEVPCAAGGNDPSCATTTTAAPTTTEPAAATTTTEPETPTTILHGDGIAPTSGDCVLDATTYRPDPAVWNVYYGCFSLGERFLVPRPRGAAADPTSAPAGGGSGPGDLSWDVGTALAALLAGPVPAELDAGYGSFFSEETAGMLLSVVLADGALVVDFADFSQIIPNASTSTGSQSLLDQLDATVFQFPDATSVEYRFDGSCDGFSNWLQRECRIITRTEWEVDPPQIAGVFDEVQFALLTEVSDTNLVADYAQLLTGDEANQAAFEDGVIGSVDEGVPNDYYIRNTNPQLRTLPLAPDARVVLVSGAVEPVLVPIADWLVLFKADGTPWNPAVETTPDWPGPHFGYFGAGTVYSYYWLAIDNGEVVQIVQQYRP